MMTLDEFRFLTYDAGRVQRLAPLPRMRRIRHENESGRTIGALQTTDLLAQLEATVVFLHGAGLNAHTFDPTILSLGENALSIDLPGHGRSDWRMDAQYTPDAMMPDLVETINAVTTGPLHIVGHSLGGLCASTVIDPLRERIQTVTLIDVTPGIAPNADASSVSEFISGQRDFASIDEMVDRAIAFGLGTDRQSLTRGVSLNTRQRSDGRFEWSHHFAHLNGLEATMASSDDQPFARLWDDLTSLGGAVSLIRGSEGFINNHLQSEWRNRLPQSEIYTVTSGHNLHEHAPIELARVLREILT